MAADRQFPTSGTGAAYMAKIAEEGTALYNAACLPLSVTGGTANDPVCTCAPALTAGILAGMSFWWTASADNTGPMTMVIDGNAAVPMKNDDGADLAAGVIKGGRRYLLTAFAGALIVTGTVNIQKVDDYQVFDTVGAFTWYKPVGCPANALVVLRLWGGGGGGGTVPTASNRSSSGGGGGGYVQLVMRAGDIADSVAGTVGAGGAIATAGGNSSFGAYAIAYAGGKGGGNNSTDASNGGNGGGAFRSGANGTNAASTIAANNGQLGDKSAGNGGGNPDSTNNGVAPAPGGEGGITGGGGGGGAGISTNKRGDGGAAIFAGGGGGGLRGNTTDAGAGGTSLYGGNGGNGGADGSPRGGGGGGGAKGGRGEIIIHVIG